MNTLIVTSENKISEISDYFTLEFPQLRLEFYGKPHDAFKGSPSRQKLDSQLTVQMCKGNAGELRFAGNMMVKDFESQVKEKLGLNVQVFRKSGKVWLETTTTDDWTLDEQNSRGAEAFH